MHSSWQNQNQHNLSPLYKNWAGYQQMMHWYNHQFAGLTMDYQALQTPTRFGPTHVTVVGDTKNPPLVLLTTAGDNASMWFGFLPALLQWYRLYIPDIIGAVGRSGHYLPSLSNLDYGLWLLDTLAVFNLLPADIVVYRHGSPVLFKAAAVDSHQIRRAMIFAPGGLGKIEVNKSKYSKYSHMWHSFWFDLNRSPANGRKIALDLCSKQAKTTLSEAALLREVELLVLGRNTLNLQVLVNRVGIVLPDYEIAALRCPTTIYFGADDILFPPLKQAEIAQRLLPHAKLEIVPGAGGMFLLEKPEFVVNAINQFFN